MSKYGNVRTERDGIQFASKAEARRYDELKLLERAGQISNLELQPRYPSVVEGHQICNYIGDFEYVDTATGATILEDVKGSKQTLTQVYKLKSKLVKALYDIEITEVMS